MKPKLEQEAAEFAEFLLCVLRYLLFNYLKPKP
jgi:hypothetical protein